MFPVTRIYADAYGESHFEDIDVPLHDSGIVGMLSDPVTVKTLIFREVAPDYDWDFHPAPQRQYIVLLEGQIEIETSLGKKRVFHPGQILLVEDTTGTGHRTRNLLPFKRRSLFITL